MPSWRAPYLNLPLTTACVLEIKPYPNKMVACLLLLFPEPLLVRQPCSYKLLVESAHNSRHLTLAENRVLGGLLTRSAAVVRANRFQRDVHDRREVQCRDDPMNREGDGIN
jgi:hypothetical protein